MNGNIQRRHHKPDSSIQTHTVGTQSGDFPAYSRRYSNRDVQEEQWLSDQYRPRGVAGQIRARTISDAQREAQRAMEAMEAEQRADSDSERRSRIDHGRRHLREAFFSSVTGGPRTAPTSPCRHQDGSLSPGARTKSPTMSDDGSPGEKTSFKIRSATYFSPKPYSKTPHHPEDPNNKFLELPHDHDSVGRRIGPLRKLHSASEKCP